jgi:hypothetical protein
MAWGVNTVFGMTPGYDVKLLESNGRGYESFQQTIEKQDNEFVIAVAGQTVTTEGGAGFQNSDVHKSIRADLIKETADGLAYTINTQVLPPWILSTFGEDALSPGAAVEWDVTPPKDRNAEASALATVAQALTQLRSALAPHGLRLDAKELATTFGVPLEAANEDGDRLDALSFDVTLTQALELAQRVGLQPTADAVSRIVERGGIDLQPIPRTDSPAVAIPLAPTDIAKVVRVDEARGSLQLPPWGDGAGEVSIEEFTASVEVEAETEVIEAETVAESELMDDAADDGERVA